MTAPAGDTSDSKARLRARLRAARRGLPPRARRLAAHRAARRLLAIRKLRRYRHWALYLPHGAELDTLPLARGLWRRGAQVHVPVILPDHRLRWVLWHRHTPLITAEHRIRRPARAAPARRSRQLQVMVLPVVGFDPRGTRLGAGGGYYDRIPAALSHRPLRVGYAHAAQEVAQLPRDPWDVPLDCIVTDRSLLWPIG